LFTLLA